jgi:hypothetical protein
MHVFIGKTLKLLYGITPAVNWYTLFLYFFHFTAMIILQYVFLSLSAHKISLILFSFLFILFELPLLTKLQFTSTAFVLGMSGLLLLLAGIERRGWISKRDFGISLLLLVVPKSV